MIKKDPNPNPKPNIRPDLSSKINSQHEFMVVSTGGLIIGAFYGIILTVHDEFLIMQVS
jgi:hypothetical protein